MHMLIYIGVGKWETFISVTYLCSVACVKLLVQVLNSWGDMENTTAHINLWESF